MTTQIQTVHGFSHPVVTQVTKAEEPEDDSKPVAQHYRKETAERLDRHNKQAKKEQPKKSL